MTINPSLFVFPGVLTGCSHTEEGANLFFSSRGILPFVFMEGSTMVAPSKATSSGWLQQKSSNLFSALERGDIGREVDLGMAEAEIKGWIIGCVNFMIRGRGPSSFDSC